MIEDSAQVDPAEADNRQAAAGDEFAGNSRNLGRLRILLHNVYARIRRQPLMSRRKSRSIVDRVLGLILTWGFIIYVLAIAGVWLGSTRVIEDNFSYQAVEWVGKLDELGTPLYATHNTELFESIRDHV